MQLRKNKYLTESNYDSLETLAAFGISFLAKELVKKGWKKFTKTPPPESLYSSKVSAKKVILFSMSLALVSMSIKLLTRELLAKEWDKLDGKLPERLT
ncbi:DUF4235 domain-containing protein [Marivirga salinae]|uniref:DUF4235 domain-containing protein n=1 Tax=Marivirga salinarum TaxID=3059078 RepID=A0AA49JBZ9_9BACT|nr:DUF4235 domain-containing protein [Marivirga sp. BDSF4-3]WKK77317.2 DUF4235 domain-containing protein [Marivirga sp. BDSF4-3]